MEIWSQPGSSALTGLKGRARENPVKCGNCAPNALPAQRAAGSARRSTASDPASGGLQFTLRASPATCHRPPPGPLGELARLGCCRTLRAPSTPPLGGAGHVAPGAGRPSLPPRAIGGAPGRSRCGTAKEPLPTWPVPQACVLSGRSHLSRPLQVCSAPFWPLRPSPPAPPTSPRPR